MKIRAVGRTDKGGREFNEDNFLIDKENNLFLVCDGLGGHNAGEIASLYACETVKEIYSNWKSEFNLDEKLSLLPQDVQKIVTAVRIANQRIFQDSLINPARKGMGTTITGIVLNQDGYAILVNVGDSRIYRLRDNNLEQLTKDHTEISELLEDGEITQEESKKIPGKNVITRALGEPTVKIDVFLEPLQNGDIFLLCSDGLFNVIPDEEIKKIIKRFRKNLKDACEVLIKSANNAGSRDNITSVLVEINDVTTTANNTTAKYTLEEDENEIQAITKLVRKRYKIRKSKKLLYISLSSILVFTFILLAVLTGPKPKSEKSPISFKLKVRTEPTDAILFLDGEEIGKTPITIPNLSPTEHKIKIMKDGYLPESLLFTPKDSIESQMINLKPEAIIKVTYRKSWNRDAELIIDGISFGSLESLEGKDIPIKEGKHNFAVVLNKQEIFSTTIQVKIDDIIKIIPDEPDVNYRVTFEKRRKR